MSEEAPYPLCCFILCCKIMFTIPLIAFSIWLSLKLAKPPICSIEDFQVFALNSSAPNTTKNHNQTIYFDLKLNNRRNKEIGIYYDPLNLTFYYLNNSSFPVASVTFPAIYQGTGKKKHDKSTTQVKGLNWTLAAADAGNGNAVFRVGLKTMVRYKSLFWKSRRHRLDIRADLRVGEQGEMVRKEKKKGVRLTSSGADKRIKCCGLTTADASVVVVGLFSVFVI